MSNPEGELTHTGIVNVLTGQVIWFEGSAGLGRVVSDKAARQIADALIDRKTGFPVPEATVSDRVELLAVENAALRGRLARVEALIGGPTPPIFLSDRPNKIVRVQHKNNRLGATITESMVKVDDLRAALAADADTDGGED